EPVEAVGVGEAPEHAAAQPRLLLDDEVRRVVRHGWTATRPAARRELGAPRGPSPGGSARRTRSGA
ncbi:hypothetical protein, partial [Mycobacteroides abscessus]|uniref:hypothetical protein n=1 Tax=Mycobacteroides abscessus TaxID=36809 RepID=UPI00178D05B7